MTSFSKNQYFTSDLNNLYSVSGLNNADLYSDVDKNTKDKMLNVSFYCLNNNSLSKFLRVGLSLDNFSTKIQIGNQKGFKFFFDEENWKAFLNLRGGIVNHFYSMTDEQLFPLKFADVTIYFEKINQRPVIKIQKYDGDYLYFAKESMEKLWELEEVINYRIEILKNQEFQKYFNTIQNNIDTLRPDLLTTIYNVLSSNQNKNSENVCTMLEMMAMYPNVMETKLRKGGVKRKYYEEISEF